MVFKTLIGSTKRLSKPKRYSINWSAPSRSKLQTTTKVFIKEYWLNDVVFEEFPMAGTRLTFDFYNANKKIAIELSEQNFCFSLSRLICPRKLDLDFP